MSGFAERVIDWQRRHGRHDLPWQGTRDPYRIWLSEIMLQQTQVAAVVPYFLRFLDRFPDLASLAQADEDAVLQHWSGLGYYARARNLHRAARMVALAHDGVFPRDFESILALPGVGRSTAGAIAVFAFGARHPILDGNVKRVLVRYFAIAGFPGAREIEKELWLRADALLPQRDLEAYTQGLMDLGAGICSRRSPQCGLCPLIEGCVARREARTEALPAPRPKKVLPQKHTVMLVLQRGAEVLLEKRPAPGIWGGLWSFPEVAATPEAVAVCRSRFGAEVREPDLLPELHHGFTHFSLVITPALLQVLRLDPRAGQPGLVWLGLDDAIGAAVPAPVRVILRRLHSAG